MQPSLGRTDFQREQNVIRLQIDTGQSSPYGNSFTASGDHQSEMQWRILGRNKFTF